MDLLDDDVRVINGIRRSEDFSPLLVRPVGDDPENLQGFEAVAAGELQLAELLTPKQYMYWKGLPAVVNSKQAYEHMGKANFSRLRNKVLSLGVLKQVDEGLYQKQL
jgi:hypothetical protein